MNYYTVVAFTFVLGVFASCVYAGSGELNDFCRVVSQCRDFGYLCAVNKTCQCVPGYYIPNKYGDKCVGLVDQRCKYDEHCVEGAFCWRQDKCQCKDGFTRDMDNYCSITSKNAATRLMAVPALLLLYSYLYI